MRDGKSIHHPHDKLFKLSLQNKNVAMEFLQAHLSKDLLKVIDIPSVRVEKNSYVDSRLQSTESDVLLSVKHGGSRALIYILCEHQSRVDHNMPLRIWRYVLQILHDYLQSHPAACRNKSMPIVIPIIYYNGRTRYCGELDFFKLFGENESIARENLLKPVTLVELSEVSDASLALFNWYSLMALTMKYVRLGEKLLYAMEKVGHNLSGMERAGGGQYIQAVLKYIVDRSDLRNESRFERFVRKSVSRPLGEEVMTLADRYVEKGMQQGMQQGMQLGIEQGELQGRREEKLAIAEAMLRRGLDNQLITSLTNLSEAELNELAGRVQAESMA